MVAPWGDAAYAYVVVAGGDDAGDVCAMVGEGVVDVALAGVVVD